MTLRSLVSTMPSMDEDQNKRLRAYYYSLAGHQRFLDTLTGSVLIPFGAVRPLFLELALLKKDFPDFVPFDPEQRLNADSKISIISVLSMLSMVLGRLQAALEGSADVPVTEKRRFEFISDPNLKVIVERDYEEIQRAFISRSWKSVIILCGGAIEAILTDLLSRDETAAMCARCAPNEKNITRWDLSALIDVSVELKIVSAGIQKLSHPLREYRNLVHPGNEIRNKLEFGGEEAKIAIELLHILHRDLTG